MPQGHPIDAIANVYRPPEHFFVSKTSVIGTTKNRQKCPCNRPVCTARTARSIYPFGTLSIRSIVPLPTPSLAAIWRIEFP